MTSLLFLLLSVLVSLGTSAAHQPVSRALDNRGGPAATAPRLAPMDNLGGPPTASASAVTASDNLGGP